MIFSNQFKYLVSVCHPQSLESKISGCIHYGILTAFRQTERSRERNYGTVIGRNLLAYGSRIVRHRTWTAHARDGMRIGRYSGERSSMEEDTENETLLEAPFCTVYSTDRRRAAPGNIPYPLVSACVFRCGWPIEFVFQIDQETGILEFTHARFAEEDVALRDRLGSPLLFSLQSHEKRTLEYATGRQVGKDTLTVIRPSDIVQEWD